MEQKIFSNEYFLFMSDYVYYYKEHNNNLDNLYLNKYIVHK